MRWATIVLLLVTVYAKEEESNEVTPTQPPLNLDANLRRALLKALTELENEENEKTRQGILLPHLDTRDRIIEKASASALSIFASTENSTPSTTTTEEPSERSVVIIQKSKGTQHNPITVQDSKLDPVNDAEQILTSASSSFTDNKFKNEEPRSISGLSSNLVTSNDKPRTKPKLETTTITTTTSTEESEAKVEDVQFFSAPLVAAFTVHQDERGLPKSVEPIFRTSPKPVKQEKPKLPETTINPIQDEQIRTQFALREKQRVLEDEILRLRQQQQQQNYLIREQQILHEQQLRAQKQKLFEDQLRLQNQRPFVPFNQPTREFVSDNNSRIRGSLVSFQPSISFTSQSELPLNAQQLPVKNAVEFRSSFVPQQNFPPFFVNQQQSNPTFTIVEPSLSLTAPVHNRVFRQEPDNGNFFNNGFNNNFNQFNRAPNQDPQNRFFRSNLEPQTFNRIQPPVVNQHLNNLLYNSGISRGRQQEDLNIVSKILSYNHVGGDYRFASSNVNEKKVPITMV